VEQWLIKTAESLAQNLGPWGYPVLAAAALLEYIFPPFPGDSIVALGGAWAWLASRSWLGVWVAVTSGNVMGIVLQHQVGSVLSRSMHGSKRGRIVEKLISWGLSEDRIAAMQERVRKYGVVLLVVNRFMPSFRALVFLAAGASGLSLKKTLGWGVVGCIAWNAFILGIGVWVGGNAERMLGLLGRYQTAAAWVLGTVVTLWILYKLYGWNLKRRRQLSANAGFPEKRN